MNERWRWLVKGCRVLGSEALVEDVYNSERPRFGFVGSLGVVGDIFLLRLVYCSRLSDATRRTCRNLTMIRSPLLKLGGMRTANKGDRKYNLALAYKSADLTATKQVPFELSC